MRNRSSVTVALALAVLLSSAIFLPGAASAQLPVCEIEHPEDDSWLHDTYDISGSAHVENGTIVGVDIRIDNDSWIELDGNESWSYEWHTEEVENGEHTIYARSFDGTNYSAEANITVHIHNPTAEEKMAGEIFFWVALVLVTIIIVIGIALEVRRRKQD